MQKKTPSFTLNLIPISFRSDLHAIQNGRSQYYVSFADPTGQEIELPVSKDFFKEAVAKDGRWSVELEISVVS